MTLRARAIIIVVAVVLVMVAAALTYRKYTLMESTAVVVVPAQVGSDANSMPAISAPIAFGVGVTAATRLSVQAQASGIESQLAADSSNTQLWMSLATTKQIGGDYAGALEDLQYAAKLNFSDPTPHMALGDLYTNNLKQYDKAEQEYREALAIQPAGSDPYRALFELYTTTSYKPNPTAPVDILKQGLTVNPKAVDLQILLARYYRTEGDAADAKATFDAAIANATAQGQTDLAAQIKTDAASK